MSSMILTIVIGLIVIFCAGMVQGLTSFGFGLLSLPILSLFMPLKLIVPVLIIFSLIINSMILFKIKEYVNLRRIVILIIFGIIGTPLGTYLLIILNENTLKLVIGILITISAIAMWKGYKIKVKNEKLSYIPVGFLSGILNGSVSLSGPPIILFLTNQGVEKQIFRANLTSYFLVLNIITIPTYLVSGIITKEVIKYSIYLLPGLILGVLLGIKLGNKVNEAIFKKLTLVLMIVMGILSIVSSLA